MAGAHRTSNSFSIILQMETLRLQRSNLGLDMWLPAPRPGLLLPSVCRHRPLGQGEHSMWTGLRGPLTSSRSLSRPPHALSLSVLTYEMNTVLPACDPVERFRAVRSWSWHMAGKESVFSDCSFLSSSPCPRSTGSQQMVWSCIGQVPEGEGSACSAWVQVILGSWSHGPQQPSESPVTSS